MDDGAGVKSAPTMPTKSHLAWLLPVLAIGAALRIAATLRTGPRIAGDTPEYLQLAHQIAALDLTGDIGQRTPLYPLFMLAFRYNANLIQAAQMVLGLLITAITFYAILMLCRRPAAAAAGAALYGFSLPQIRIESYMLSETLTTFLLALLGIAVVWLWNDRHHFVTLKLTAMALCAGLLPLVRPAYAFVPLVATAVALAWARAPIRRVVTVAAIAFLPMLAWSTFNLARVDSFGLSTGLGLNLTNKTGSYIEDAPDEYADIRDLYLQARADDGGEHLNTIWRHYESMMKATGLSFNELSDRFLRMNLELLTMYPRRYVANVATAFLDFYKFGGYDSTLPGLGGMTNLFWQVERWLNRLVGAAFLLIVAFWTFRVVLKRTWRPVTPLFWFSVIVLAADAISALVEFGDGQRFGMPTEPLMFTVVVVTSTGVLERLVKGERLWGPGEPVSVP